MPNSAKLIEKLEKLYLMEKKAEDMYAKFLSSIGDQESRDKVSSVIKDEIKHEQLVQALIKMAKSTNN